MTIRKRLAALEGKTFGNGFAHRSDEDLRTELVDTCEQLERRGHAMPDNWRGAIEQEDYRALEAIDGE